MKIKYKLALMFILIILSASLPVSLLILHKLKQDKIESATQQGKAFSAILAQTVLNIILANGGDLKSAQIDIREMMRILKTLKKFGLVYADAILISSKEEINGMVLASYQVRDIRRYIMHRGNHVSDSDISRLINQSGYNEFVVPDLQDIFYEFAFTGYLPDKKPLCIGRLIFSKDIIVEPVIQLQQFIFFVTAIFIVIVGLLGLFISRLIYKPIDILTEAARRVENGEIEVNLEIATNDEIGRLASTFNHMLKIINQKIQELEQTNLRLTQLDILKDEFLANISHELRTPLYGIIGISESLLMGVAGRLNDEALHDLSLIIASGRRLASLVNDILDFSKLKYHDMLIEFFPVNLHDIIQLVLSIVRPLFEKKKIIVNNEVNEKDVIVNGDLNRLQQIFLNLIGNAIKFTDDGSITISVSEYYHDRSFYLIIISDTGIGIPSQQMERIFESFEQVDGTITRIHGGAGLGLAISKKIIELHGGIIWVESEQGKGTSVKFTLQKSSYGAAVKSEETRKDAIDEILIRDKYDGVRIPSSDLHGKEGSVSKKILVVDDEPVNLQVIINHLSLEGYSINTAQNGEEVFDIIQTGEIPDLILLDVMLPRISGYDICRKIRETHSSHVLPIIMITAKNKTGDAVTGLHAGANDYISKPINSEELLARVANLISMKDSIKIQNDMAVIKNELEIAIDIQKSILPLELPRIENISFAVRYEASTHVGGDLYDFHIINDRKVGVMIADIAGHGIPAALVASMVQMAYSFYKSVYAEPSQLFGKINTIMCGYSHGQYLTACSVYIDLDSMKMYHTNAGHRPIIIWRKIEQRLFTDKIYDRPMGIFTDSVYRINELELKDHDRIILYTDGIVEARNHEKMIFGDDRLHELIINYQHLNADELADCIVASVKRWSGLSDAESLVDDITIIIIDIKIEGKSL